MIATSLNRYVIGREHNVVRVDFSRRPEPPGPPFPGAGAMRACTWPPPENAGATVLTADVA